MRIPRVRGVILLLSWPLLLLAGVPPLLLFTSLRAPKGTLRALAQAIGEVGSVGYLIGLLVALTAGLVAILGERTYRPLRIATAALTLGGFNVWAVSYLGHGILSAPLDSESAAGWLVYAISVGLAELFIVGYLIVMHRTTVKSAPVAA